MTKPREPINWAWVPVALLFGIAGWVRYGPLITIVVAAAGLGLGLWLRRRARRRDRN